MANRLLFIITTLFLSVTATAQVTFTGKVTVSNDGSPVVGANILLYSKDGKGLYCFSSTGAEGDYSVSFKGEADSLMVRVTGFNVKPTIRVVPAVSQRLDFAVIFEEISIREVVVKAEPVTRRSDTLNYYVSSYIDSLDSSIGDVLRKMPGIDVDKSGLIKYNDKPINKFYIEGLDMMGGRYGVATNNVRAQDIASVQILENHQPIKTLKDISFSDAAAINLKLKDKAKGAFAATVLLGGGYKPWMWNAQLAMMQFSSNFQMLTTYKTNNSGNDITSEQTSFYGGLENEASLLGVHTPGTPDTEKERYMDNMTHAVSVNTIGKLKKDRTLTANGLYIHDLQNYAGTSVTTYYLPEESPLVVSEVTTASSLTDRMEVGVKFNNNSDKVYLNENVTFGADWNRDEGMVLNGEDTVSQRYRLPRLRLKNDFSFVKVIGGVRLNFQSVTNAAQLPSSLAVTPVIYPELFGERASSDGTLIQQLNNKKLNTANSLWASYTFRGRYTVYGSAGFNADLLGMKSALDREESSVDGADSLRNDLSWRRLDAVMQVGFIYRHGKMDASVSAKLDYMNLDIDDRVRFDQTRIDRFYVDPYLTFNYKISPSLKLSARGSLYHGTGAAGSTYAGYIMTDYRMISSNDSRVRESLNQNYNAELTYGDAILSLFGSLSAAYWRTRSNLMYGTRYYGSLSRIESFAIENTSQGFYIRGRIEKRFDDISTTVAVPVSYNRSYCDVLRQGEIMKTVNYGIPMGLDVSSRFSDALMGVYRIDYQRSKSIIEGESSELSPIDALHQKLELNFTFFKSLTLKVSGEHYFNSRITSGSRSMFFTDASVVYKTKRFEYILEGRNLLNTQSYNQRIYSDITDYEYSYQLRPVSVMFKIKFSIR